MRLAKVAGSVDGESVESYAIDEASGLVTSQMVDGMFVLEPDLVGIRTALSGTNFISLPKKDSGGCGRRQAPESPWIYSCAYGHALVHAPNGIAFGEGCGY